MKWTDIHDRFIAKRYWKISRLDLLNEFNNKFDLNITIKEFNLHLKDMVLPKNSIRKFEHRQKEVGERWKDGVIHIKMGKGRLKVKHTILYEQHHGEKLKPDELIIFMDGNKKNLNIENLIKITRRQLMSIIGRKLIRKGDDISKSEKLIAIIEMHDKLAPN